MSLPVALERLGTPLGRSCDPTAIDGMEQPLRGLFRRAVLALCEGGIH